VTKAYFMARMREILLRDGSADVYALLKCLEDNVRGGSQPQRGLSSPEDWVDREGLQYETHEFAVAEVEKVLLAKPVIPHPQFRYQIPNYIDAIKCFRLLTGAGLKDSKDAVDTVIARLGLVVGPPESR